MRNKPNMMKRENSVCFHSFSRTSLENMFRGIDEEESEFLTLVDSVKAKEERQKRLEERSLLELMRESARHKLIQDEGPSSALVPPAPSPGVVKKTSKQAAILSTAIKRKSYVFHRSICLGLILMVRRQTKRKQRVKKQSRRPQKISKSRRNRNQLNRPLRVFEESEHIPTLIRKCNLTHLCIL